MAQDKKKGKERLACCEPELLDHYEAVRLTFILNTPLFDGFQSPSHDSRVLVTQLEDKSALQRTDGFAAFQSSAAVSTPGPEKRERCTEEEKTGLSVEGQGEAKWLLGCGVFFFSASCLFLGFGAIEGLAGLFVFSQL